MLEHVRQVALTLRKQLGIHGTLSPEDALRVAERVGIRVLPVSPEELRMAASDAKDLEVITYDQLLERAKNLARGLDKSP